MKYLILLCFTCAFITTLAQQSVPVFQNKKDSAEYSQIQLTLQALLRSEQNTSTAKQIDSLFKLQTKFREKIIGYKILFEPDKKFTPYKELVNKTVDPLSITKLSISNYTESKVPAEVFKCINLQELELVNTRIKKIPNKLNKLEKLKSIYIYNNVTARALKLGKNSHVKGLLLNGTESKSLPKSYRKLTSLEELNLAQNIGLSKFPDIYRNFKLKKLNLPDNQITLQDLKATQSISLEELNLQKNKISIIPTAIGSFTGLKKLTCNYNQITDIRIGFENLKNLEEVSFYQNQLTTLPSSLYKLPKLKTIDLYHNQIVKIDTSITNLKNLEILYLSNNQLSTLPENIGDLKNLKELYLSNNKLFVLPQSLHHLKNLTTLRVNKNKLTDFPEFVLDINTIENIDISSNSIHLIPQKITGLPNLKIFVLGDNPVNKEEVNIYKIIQELMAKGTIVHQNFIEIKSDIKTP